MAGFKTKVFSKVPIKGHDEKRDRRMTDQDRKALMQAHGLIPRQNTIVEAMYLAIETAMRRNELCSLTWEMVHFDRKIITLPARITKTKRGREIPMSPKCIEILKRLQKKNTPLVLNLTTTALNTSWQRWKNQASKIYSPVKSLRFHDLRHEAISRLAEMSWTIPEMMVMSGHADQRCLLRYVQLKAENLVDKFPN
jgi:integrase